MNHQDSILLGVKLLFALLALGAVALFIVRPIWRMLVRTEEAELVMKPFEPPPESELEIPVDGFNTGRKLSRNEIIEELRADPRKTALLLQQWMKEKKPSRGGDPSPKRR